MRRAVAVLLSGLVAGGILLGTAAPALAHNVLVASDPKDGTSLDAGPQSISLTFDQDVNGGENLNTITVIGPDNTHWEAVGEPTIVNNTVTTQVRPLGPAAQYTVGYRILSADGHPVTGSLKFTLTKAGTGTPAPANEIKGGNAPAATGSITNEAGGGTPIWPWLVGAAVLLGGGVYLALRSGAKQA